MVATVSVAETNTSAATVTASITNMNMGSADAVNLVAATYPITASTNSYEKWLRFNWSAGTATSIGNLKVWSNTSSDAVAGVEIKTNAASSNSGTITFPTSSGPSCVNRAATYLYAKFFSTAAPSFANVPIGGQTSSTLTAAGYSDYIVTQIQTSTAAVAGRTATIISFQYDEVA